MNFIIHPLFIHHEEEFKMGLFSKKFDTIKENENIISVTLHGAIGNGIADDTNAIQDAIIEANKKGINAVYFPTPSVAYMVDVSKPIIVPSNMKLFGNKGLSVIKIIPTTVKNDPNYFYKGINSIFVPGTYNNKNAFTKDAFGYNIHFDGLVLDGNYSMIDQTGFLKEANSFGFKCLYVKKLSITNCEARNFIGSGIYTFGCTQVTIDKNHVHHNGQFVYNGFNGYTYANGVNRNGISLAGGYLGVQSIQEKPYSYDYTVSNNIVHDNIDEGIMYSYQKRLLIIGNTVHNNGDKGIEGDIGYTTTDTQDDNVGNDIPGDISIISNFIYDHPHSAITHSSSNMAKIKVSNNVIRNCGQYGVFLEQNDKSSMVVTENIIYNYGTEVAGDGTNYHAISITGHYVKISDNYIHAPIYDFNIPSNGGTSTGSGISVARAYTCTIQDNTIIGGGKLGINVDIWKMGDLGETMNNLTLQGNNIYQVHRQGIYINANLLTRINQVTLSENVINNYQTGYNYADGSSYTLYSGIDFGSNTRIQSLTAVGNSVYQDTDNTIIISTGLPLGKKVGQNAMNLPSTVDYVVNCVITGNELAYGGQFASLNNDDKPQFTTISGNSIFGKRIMYASAVPTGTVKQYYRGDIIFNTAPSQGGSIGWVCTASGKVGTWVEFGSVKQQRSGQLVYNGDGSSTTKTIAHGLSATPTAYFVQAVSIDAGNAVVKRVTADSTNLTITFATAPIAGTNNVTLNWRAEV
jgi:parallel beta-helix repeat protein